MIRFAKRIQIEDRELHFNFSEVVRLNSSKYYVSVTEQNTPVAAFEMKQEGFKNKWIVCQPAPEWVIKTEPVLATFIDEYLS